MIPVFINDTLQSNVTLKCKLVYTSNSLPKVDTKNLTCRSYAHEDFFIAKGGSRILVRGEQKALGMYINS